MNGEPTYGKLQEIVRDLVQLATEVNSGTLVSEDTAVEGLRTAFLENFPSRLAEKDKEIKELEKSLVSLRAYASTPTA